MTESDIRFRCQNSDVNFNSITPIPPSNVLKGTWKIDKFFSICKKEYMISSQLLSFNGCTGKFSVLTNGTVTSYGDLIVVLYLNTGLSQIEKAPEFCEIGLKANNVKISMSSVSVSLKCLYCNFGNLDDVINELIGPEDSLTVVCKLSMKKNSSATKDTETNICFDTNENIDSSQICRCPIDLCVLTEYQCGK